MPVAVVTDSTANLPGGLAARHGLRVVPLHVTIDGVSGSDTTSADAGPSPAADLVAALQRHAVVSTSRPTPAEFAEVYRDALGAGADGVLSVHLSRALSGTWEAARLAAEQVGADRVRVVDSGSMAMGVGFVALAAANEAAAGAELAEVFDAAAGVARRTRTFFSVDTLDYLRRGGRIGTASALLGTALSVKPLLHVADGRIVPLEKVRTAVKARARLVELAVDAAGNGPVDVAVQHLGAADRAAQLVELLTERLPELGSCLVSELGPVVGAHAGPGVLGVVVLPGGLSNRSD